MKREIKHNCYKKASPSTGFFIVFEGIDGSGKSTQARMLAERLQRAGIPAILTAEPSNGPTGLLIRSFTTRPDPDEEARLFTRDRREHVELVILPALREGRVVICDRYVYSSVAYQGARGLDPAGIFSMNRSFAPAADVTILLAVPLDLALARIRKGRASGFSSFEKGEDLEAVDAIYRSLDDPGIRVVDGNAPQEVVHDRIVEILRHAGLNLPE